MKKVFQERQLAVLAQRFREAAGKTRAQAAREMKVSQVSIFRAEESPEESLTKLRRRMVEKFSPFKVAGPFYQLQRK
ncbi:MAG: XRE family transcriptional regulator [Verrucomicrobia bacterium]|nr:MAG: XRE family transcriptional regulator [Verrucomicrobiota bacterium]